MLIENDIIKLIQDNNIVIIPKKHDGVDGIWITDKECWNMIRTKEPTAKEFRKLVMQFIVEQKEFNKDQKEFNTTISNKLETVSNKLETVIVKNKLKT